MPEGSPLRAGVGMASAGRPELLGTVLANLDEQRAQRSVAVVSVPDESSLPHPVPDGWRVVTGSRGLAAQRNAAVDAMSDVDVVFFFDDDAVIRADFIANGMAFFEAHPDVIAITGRVLLDGATLGEIGAEEAVQALRDSEEVPLTGGWRSGRSLYGCNFAFRLSAGSGVRFDARLPLYSWLEDHDFARRIGRLGTIAVVDDCVIVHRGAASGGRTVHRQLGYSQMMNRLHLRRTGSFPLWLAMWEIFRPTAKNVVRSVGGSQRSWRRQRLRANGLALVDFLRGRVTPERILEL